MPLNSENSDNDREDRLVNKWFANRRKTALTVAMAAGLLGGCATRTDGPPAAATLRRSAQCGWAWKALLAIFQPSSVLSSTK